MKKEKRQIFLIGKDLDRSLQIGIGLTTELKVPEDTELEVISIQTERDYRLLVTQGYTTRQVPLAVLVDGYVVMDNGSRSYPVGLIHNLQQELGYTGPIIACAEQPLINDHLIKNGATHRIGEPAPEGDLGVPIDIDDIIKGALAVIGSV